MMVVLRVGFLLFLPSRSKHYAPRINGCEHFTSHHSAFLGTPKRPRWFLSTGLETAVWMVRCTLVVWWDFVCVFRRGGVELVYSERAIIICCGVWGDPFLGFVLFLSLRRTYIDGWYLEFSITIRRFSCRHWPIDLKTRKIALLYYLYVQTGTKAETIGCASLRRDEVLRETYKLVQQMLLIP